MPLWWKLLGMVLILYMIALLAFLAIFSFETFVLILAVYGFCSLSYLLIDTTLIVWKKY